MLRISKLTDYGVVLATELAVRSDRPLAVRDLSASTGVPEPTAAKVLKVLVRAGVLESVRGARGGYRMARSPELVTVAEVIEALEGPIAVTECSTDETAGSCEHEGVCGVQANWQRINAAVQGALQAISLADMTRPSFERLVSLARTADEAERLRSAAAD
ncbi:MAG TPA: SUF system Fe-S cluster assembly regulator [Polyangiaceae bacterium LLY-WYZ-14_1]|nr:SUF system Fe-S cluster assembly regulator [Polyangiaceae bacterium LLY-WYZ-14_1]